MARRGSSAYRRRRGRIVGDLRLYGGRKSSKHARELVAAGELGEIRLVNLQFAHGFWQSCRASKPGDPLARRSEIRRPKLCARRYRVHIRFIFPVILPDLRINRLLYPAELRQDACTLEDNAMTLMEYDNGRVWHRLVESAINAGSMHGQRCARRRIKGFDQMVGRAAKPADLKSSGR